MNNKLKAALITAGIFIIIPLFRICLAEFPKQVFLVMMGIVLTLVAVAMYTMILSIIETKNSESSKQIEAKKKQ
jgi:hypothetical protein